MPSEVPGLALLCLCFIVTILITSGPLSFIRLFILIGISFFASLTIPAITNYSSPRPAKGPDGHFCRDASGALLFSRSAVSISEAEHEATGYFAAALFLASLFVLVLKCLQCFCIRQNKNAQQDGTLNNPQRGSFKEGKR